MKLKQAFNSAFFLSLSMAYTSPSMAVTDAEFKALQDQLNSLADVIESTNSGTSTTTIGGYGDLHYNNLDGSDAKIDFHRFVLFIGHEFSSRVRFFSEFELEHALVQDTDTDTTCIISDVGNELGTLGADNIINANEVSCGGNNISKSPGAVELEQAYVQIDIGDNKTFNAGLFLIPVGILNDTHEPPTFYGVERNPVEKNIIPTTWWEAGVMLSGNTNDALSYDLAITSGLDGGTNIRSGRQKVAKATANNLAFTGRLKYTGIAGLEVAGTMQIQTDMTQDTTDNIDGATLIETHAVLNKGAFTGKVLYARWDISGAGTGNKDIQSGFYLEGGYKMNPKLGMFSRFNTWNNGASKKEQVDVGLNYWPHEDVVFKIDYQLQNNNAGGNDGFNAGFGYQF